MSTSITNNPSSVTILPSTNIDWRRMAYKQRRTDAFPLRTTIKNNFPYVTTYSTSSNSINVGTSSGIIFETPNSQSSNQAFKCMIREYLPTKYHLYTEYNVPCEDWSTTQVLIRARLDHINKPEYFYEYIIYQNKGSSSPFLSSMSGANRNIKTWSGQGYSGSWTSKYINLDGIYKYQSTSSFTLHSIYILTREAAVVNSLWINFNINVATPNIYFLEL